MAEKQKDRKITFLFGAGAEKSFGLPTGKEFAKDVLLLNKELQTQVKSFYESQGGKDYKGTRLIYAASRSVYFQTIFENESEFSDLCKRVSLNPSPNDIYNDYKSYKKCTTAQGRAEKKRFKEPFDEICKKTWEQLSRKKDEPSNTENHDLEELEYKKLAEFILEHVKYYAQIDKQFNSLRRPQNDLPEYWTVLNTYAAAFFSIFNKMYQKKATTKQEIIEMLKNEERKMPDSPSYYHVVKDNYKGEYACITTNYTPYIAELLDKNTAYLHGKLSWFEDILNLAVYDVEKEADIEKIKENFVFPFIFVQSGIKPIVSKKQIEELHKAVAYLDESDTLVVVGYNFNSDDNHINSMIADWLREDNSRQLIFFKHINLAEEKTHRSEETLKDELLKRCQWLNGIQEQIIVKRLCNIDDFQGYITQLSPQDRR